MLRRAGNVQCNPVPSEGRSPVGVWVGTGGRDREVAVLPRSAGAVGAVTRVPLAQAQKLAEVVTEAMEELAARTP